MAYTLTKIAADHYSIDWQGEWVYQCRHPWLARVVLSILRDMGDPHLWSGCFATALRRRVWRLYRVVPCSCSHGSKEGKGSPHRYQMCRRPNETETHLGEPHATRRDSFDQWLALKV